jgi:Mg/Co/Ni transporter MgtE
VLAFFSILSALQTRLFPLLLTVAIEMPVVLLMVRNSGHMCRVLGRYHHQQLLSLMPLMAAISGNLGLQASQLTISAISHGQISASTLRDWIRSECLVSIWLGIGMGIGMGIVAFWCFRQDNSLGDFVFAWVVGMAQAISAIAAGCSASMSPFMLAWLLQHSWWKFSSSQTINGLVERALQDVTTALLTTTLCYSSFAILVALNGPEASDACLV